MAGDIEFIIVKHIATLSTSPKGWQREVNLVSWNRRPAKLDVRDWDPYHEKMGKGITLTNEEADKLAAALINYQNEMDLDESDSKSYIKAKSMDDQIPEGFNKLTDDDIPF